MLRLIRCNIFPSRLFTVLTFSVISQSGLNLITLLSTGTLLLFLILLNLKEFKENLQPYVITDLLLVLLITYMTT
jgi:hypothetical protein